MGSASSQKVSHRSDRELLRRFLENRDEPAITEIITRHAPLVRGVCQRLLGNSQDADDAFQATFLVLIRKGERVQVMDSLAGWLYGVAYRIARRQRRQRSRAIANVKETDVTIAADPFAELATRYDVALFEAELARLPEKYRAPIVLHHLEDKSQREVAEELKLTEGAVDGLLKRGRQELRVRLARRGVIFGVAVAVLEQTQAAIVASETQPLIEAAVQTVLSFDPVLNPNVPRTTSVRWAQQEINVMTLFQVAKVAASTGVALLLFGAVGLGISSMRQDLSMGPASLIASELESIDAPANAVIALAVNAAEENPAPNGEETAHQAEGVESAPPATEVQDSKLNALRQERLAALREGAALALRMFKDARIELEEILRWESQLNDAELKASTNDGLRRLALERSLAKARQIEAIAEQRKETARGTEVELLKVKVYRLDLEIALEQLRQK